MITNSHPQVRCMKLVQHPNVVRLYEVIDTNSKLYLILELGDGGDLYDYIMKHDAGMFKIIIRKENNFTLIDLFLISLGPGSLNWIPDQIWKFCEVKFNTYKSCFFSKGRTFFKGALPPHNCCSFFFFHCEPSGADQLFEIL